MEREDTKPFFEKISFLNQTDVKKQEIAKIIIEENNGDALYWIEIVLSISIATFGLLQNSVAVIIGAMLIAPLLRPMQGMSFAMATGQSGFFWKATWFLFKSVVISIIIAYLFALLIPLKTETVEILSRITPNILDLFIAVFSAIIAFLSFGFKRLSASVAGVAMAASLIPPLAVVGIELSLGNIFAAWGSFLLFFINFLAILLVGVVVFFFYGFTPHQELQKKISIRKFLTLIAIIIFTSVPLYSSFSDITLQVETEKKALEFLSHLIPLKIPNSTLKEVTVISVDDENIHLKGVLQVPENTEVFETTYSSILKEAEEYLGKSLEFDFEMIRTANLKSSNRTDREKEKILRDIKILHNSHFPSFSILQILLDKTDVNDWNLYYVLSIPNGEYLTGDMKSLFIKELEKKYENNNFSVEWIGIAGSVNKGEEKELTQEELIQKDIVKNIQELLVRPEMNGVMIEKISVSISETEEIFFHARVLYPQVFEKEKKYEERETSLSLPDVYSLLVEKNPDSLNLPEVTPFSIENDVEFFSQNPSSLSKKISESFELLPYSNIKISFNFIPYYQEEYILNKE